MKRVPIKSTPTKRKRDFDAAYASLLPGVLARGCEFPIYANPCLPPNEVAPEWRTCYGRLVGHPAKGRQARDANDYVLCLCDKHHRFVHANPRWARSVGLMLSRTS
jgi:hypothetical protein